MTQYQHGIIIVSPSSSEPLATIQDKTTGNISQIDPTAIPTLNPEVTQQSPICPTYLPPQTVL
eukprot:10993731-Ditylum_brightwellii.AAC.1